MSNVKDTAPRKLNGEHNPTIGIGIAITNTMTWRFIAMRVRQQTRLSQIVSESFLLVCPFFGKSKLAAPDSIPYCEMNRKEVGE